MRWLIRKAAMVSDQPVDTVHASILGPNTEAVEVVPALAAERLEGVVAEQHKALASWVERAERAGRYREALMRVGDMAKVANSGLREDHVSLRSISEVVDEALSSPADSQEQGDG